ncbi:MAG: hypothetical protein V4447_10300 [Pseudomonadota bacterium]
MRTSFLILLFLALPAFASEPALPDGWRNPTVEELQDGWRNDCPDRCAQIAADFNGKGRAEGALLAIHEKRKVMGLLAFVYTAPGKAQWFVLDEIKDPTSIAVMGVQLYAPGTYKMMCVESEKQCGPDGKKPFNFRLPAISYFKSESASSVFYWSERHRKFERIWESD